MSDKTKDPAPPLNPLLPSYSIEVPTPAPAGVATAPSYIRAGSPDQTSNVERQYYAVGDGKDATANANAWNKQKPGIVMWSPNDILKIAKSTTTFTTSEETLKVNSDANAIVSSTYTFKDPLGYRDVSYKVSQTTGWSIGAAQSWSVGISTGFSLSVDQKISIGASFGAKATADVGVSVSLVDVKATADTFEAKIKGRGDYAITKADATQVGTGSLTLSVSPIANLFNAEIVLWNGRLATLLKVIGGLGATTLAGAPASLNIANAVKKEDETTIKGWSETLGYVGSAEMAILFALQAAYMLLAVKAAAVGKAWVPGVGTSLQMDTTSITLTTPTSSMKLGPTGIALQVGATNIKLDLTGTEVNGPQFDATATVSRMAIDSGGVYIAGPSVQIKGSAVVRIAAPSVTF